MKLFDSLNIWFWRTVQISVSIKESSRIPSTHVIIIITIIIISVILSKLIVTVVLVIFSALTIIKSIVIQFIVIIIRISIVFPCSKYSNSFFKEFLVKFSFFLICG